MPRSLAEALRLASHRKSLILSPRVTEYLSKHLDGLYFSEETAERIKSLITRKPRVRSGSFSPSSAGYCRRRQVFDFIGTPGKRPQPIDLRNLFADGTWRHLRWQAMGLEDGWFTDVEVSAAVPGTLFKGSMDGDNTEEGWLFELKGTTATERTIRNHILPAAEALNEGLDPTQVEVTDPHVEYFIKNWQQVQRYFSQTGGRYTAAVLMYEPKGTQSFVEVNLTATKVGQSIARQEMDSLASAADDKRLPAVLKECMSKNSPKKKNCVYGKVCLHTYDWGEAQPAPSPRSVTIKRKR